MKMKQQLGSLLFLKKIIKSHLKKFDNCEDAKSLSDSLNDDNDSLSKVTLLCVIICFVFN